MFFTSGFETAKPTCDNMPNKLASQTRDVSSFTARADRDFERFVAQHGPFKKYLPYPI